MQSTRKSLPQTFSKKIRKQSCSSRFARFCWFYTARSSKSAFFEKERFFRKRCFSYQKRKKTNFFPSNLNFFITHLLCPWNEKSPPKLLKKKENLWLSVVLFYRKNIDYFFFPYWLAACRIHIIKKSRIRTDKINKTFLAVYLIFCS